MTAGVSGQILRRTPRARCQECGGETVVALCCNCAAFLCGKHDRVADLQEAQRIADGLLRRAIRRPAGGQPDALERVPAAGENLPEAEPDAEAEPGTSTGPEPKELTRRHFCPNCVPVGHPSDVQVFAAAAGLLLGIVLTALNTFLGTLLIIASLGWLGVRLGTGLVRRRRGGRVRARRKVLFLAPQVRKLELTETVIGRCKLDPERRQTLVVDDVRGTIHAGLRWDGGHAAEAAMYRARFPADRHGKLRAEAGHLVLRGAGQLDLAHSAGCEVNHPAQVALRPWLADHEVLSHPDGSGDARWDVSLTYAPEKPPGGWSLPVWVTASFTPDSDHRSLDVRVQWRTAAPISDLDTGPTLTAKELTRVRLEVPAVWGPVQKTTLEDVEQVLVGPPVDGVRSIEWKKPGITKGPRGSRDLSVSFPRSVDSSATVQGEVEITFAEAVSGITAVQLHAPGGGRRRDGTRPTIKTRMRVAFDLSLAGIAHQQSHTVPDATNPESIAECPPFKGIRPDQHLVVEVVRQLADQGYLVKSVVEHPTRPGRGVGLQYRVWDVTGRRYRGVHPIDFRITVTGDEAEAGAAAESVTSIRLIVRGVHASESMQQEIVKAYEEVWARIEFAVAASRTGADGHVPRLPSEPLAAVASQLATLEGTLLSITQLVGDGERDGHIRPGLADRIRDAVELSRSGGT